MKYIKSKRTKTLSKNKFYNVENIITRKNVGKRQFYLIKWEGYPIKDCSWEPISNLSNIMDMVKEFDENFPFSINQNLMNEFILEFKKYKHNKLYKKINNKKRKSKETTHNKIIIALDDVDNKSNKEKEKEKEQSIIEIEDQKINGEKLIINNTTFNNRSNKEKLIKPIIIW